MSNSNNQWIVFDRETREMMLNLKDKKGNNIFTNEIPTVCENLSAIHCPEDKCIGYDENGNQKVMTMKKYLIDEDWDKRHYILNVITDEDTEYEEIELDEDFYNKYQKVSEEYYKLKYHLEELYKLRAVRVEIREKKNESN